LVVRLVPFPQVMRVARGSPTSQSRCQLIVHRWPAVAALLAVVGLAVASSGRGFCGLAPSAPHRISGGSRTDLRATALGGGIRWEEKVPAGQDPLFAFKTQAHPDKPLPWKSEECEVMVDAMSIIKWYWKRIEEEHEDLLVQNDLHVGWPVRVLQAAHVLAKHYGRDRPPSPWCPVIVVYDQPHPSSSFSGKKIKTWKNLGRQGPRSVGLTFPQASDEIKVTCAYGGTYVDQSASGKTRCDREILYMLEIITRDFPRRQVLVTEDRALADDATRYCTVRGAKWFESEILKLGGKKHGPNIIEALMGGSYGIEKVTQNLPKGISKAFLSL